MYFNWHIRVELSGGKNFQTEMCDQDAGGVLPWGSFKGRTGFQLTGRGLASVNAGG